MITLRRITVYPIKSLPGVRVNECRVLPSGALENDRRLALVDAEGNFVNGKRCPAIHRVRAEYDTHVTRVKVQTGASPPQQFPLTNHDGLARWLSGAVGVECRLVENAETGFPDDTESPGPTVIGETTLKTVAGWFRLKPEEARRRFRANVELATHEPFWEDRLVGEVLPVEFTVGRTVWLGEKPCQRCAVPARDSLSGESTPAFQKSFADLRESELPDWAPRGRFNHYYRLAVNTRLAAGGGEVLRVGDEVAVVE